MVKLSKIYTRGGDSGKTSLGSGERVLKHSIRVSAYGTVDEANSIIGTARLYTTGDIDKMLSRIQNDLFDLGADLCTPEGSKRKSGALRIGNGHIARLESEIDAMNEDLKPLDSFILPGGSPESAYLHHARCVVRRAERLIVELDQLESVTSHAICYINRLSDLLFVLARTCNKLGENDVLWKPGNNA